MTLEEAPSFMADIRENGYHIYNPINAEIPDYYPEVLPVYPSVSIKDLQPGDIITVRAFFGVGSGEEMEVDSGFLDLRVEEVDIMKILAVIVSDLPEEYALSLGDAIELFEEEILWKNKIQ